MSSVTNTPFFQTKDPLVSPTSCIPSQSLTFAVKSIIRTAGYRFSFGNKEWDEKNSEIQTQNAPCVQKLLDAHFELVGTVHTSTFAFDLSGENSYGMPLNPAVKNGIVGGSSSGCASAVASGKASIALGTDTGGSIRIPAAYCGLWSLRPTFGAISTEGVLPVGPASDTVGLLATQAKVLVAAGKILLPEKSQSNMPRLLYAVREMFDLCTSEIQACYQKKLEELALSHSIEWISIDQLLNEQDPKLQKMQGLREASHLLLKDTFDTLQPHLADSSELTKEVQGNLAFAKHVNQNFQDNPCLKGALEARVARYKERIQDRLEKNRTFILLPTVPHAAPKIGCGHSPDAIGKIISLTCLASLLGLPQLQMPLLATPQGEPLGLSVIGKKNDDRLLLSFGEQLEAEMPRFSRTQPHPEKTSIR